MSGGQILEMLTKPAKDFDFSRHKTETLSGTVLVSPDVYNDYLWSKRFGKREKSGIVWKYGNPWLYPDHEFEQLKTIIIGEDLAEEERLFISRTTMADVQKILGISETQKENNNKLSSSMAKFFKELS